MEDPCQYPKQHNHLTQLEHHILGANHSFLVAVLNLGDGLKSQNHGIEANHPYLEFFHSQNHIVHSRQEINLVLMKLSQ